MTHSKIIQSLSLEELNDDICEFIERGYHLHGPIQQLLVDGVQTYIQMMIFKPDCVTGYIIISAKSEEELSVKVCKKLSARDCEPFGPLVVVDHKMMPDDSDAPIHDIVPTYYQVIVYKD